MTLLGIPGAEEDFADDEFAPGGFTAEQAKGLACTNCGSDVCLELDGHLWCAGDCGIMTGCTRPKNLEERLHGLLVEMRNRCVDALSMRAYLDAVLTAEGIPLPYPEDAVALVLQNEDGTCRFTRHPNADPVTLAAMLRQVADKLDPEPLVQAVTAIPPHLRGRA